MQLHSQKNIQVILIIFIFIYYLGLYLVWAFSLPHLVVGLCWSPMFSFCLVLYLSLTITYFDKLQEVLAKNNGKVIQPSQAKYNTGVREIYKFSEKV